MNKMDKEQCVKMCGVEKPIRSLAKTISWRLVSIVVTVSVSFALTHQIGMAAIIGGTDASIKILIFYWHERYWNRISYGLVLPKPLEEGPDSLIYEI